MAKVIHGFGYDSAQTDHLRNILAKLNPLPPYCSSYSLGKVMFTSFLHKRAEDKTYMQV